MQGHGHRRAASSFIGFQNLPLNNPEEVSEENPQINKAESLVSEEFMATYTEGHVRSGNHSRSQSVVSGPREGPLLQQDKVSVSSTDEIISRLGVSEIKSEELYTLINRVFEEEYLPANIDRRVNARTARNNFDFSSKSLGIRTDVSNRLFEILEAFVTAD